MTTRATCAECGGPVVEVLVGLPRDEDFELAARGEAILWGCIVQGSVPLASCGCGETIVERAEPWGGEPVDE
jgi:hypothetical protein